jgi:hypothetical protein
MIKNWMMAIVMAFVAGGSLFVIVTPQVVAADTVSCTQSFLGFPAWYRGLVPDISDAKGNCPITSPGDNLSGFIWHVVLNIIEDAMVAVGYVTVFFILFGGFKFLTSEGDPGAAAKARTTITNAVVGLVISLVAIGAVNFIVDRLK